MNLMRIQSIAMWTAKVEFDELLNLPKGMDVRREEKKWFDAGGGTPEEFVAHLVKKGAKRVRAKTHVINYQ